LMPNLARSSVSSAPANLSLSLASSLFAEASSLTSLPIDGAYADCLLIRAFNHLSAGLNGAMDSEALTDCAENIEDCSYLSEAVRAHVGETLRNVVDGITTVALALNIVSAATTRQGEQLLMDAVGAIASQGLGDLADTLADAIDGLTEAVKATRH
jgi:hypothetical protein